MIRPAFTLAFVTLVQSVLLTLWLWQRGEGGVGAVLRRVADRGAGRGSGMLASLGWFTAFTLVTVAQVKAVGQVELVFSWLTARYAFGERPSGRETLGIALVARGIVLVILGDWEGRFVVMRSVMHVSQVFHVPDFSDGGSERRSGRER